MERASAPGLAFRVFCARWHAQVDQAALTGESLPVRKAPGDAAFSGSSVKQGERHALVYATGASTFFGRAAALISGVHNVANIQKVRVLGFRLGLGFEGARRAPGTAHTCLIA